MTMLRSAFFISSLLVLVGAMTDVGLTHADDGSPYTVRLRGDTTFELELRRAREGEACRDDWYYAVHEKSTDFELVELGDNISPNFVALKKEIWRTEKNEFCENPLRVDRIEIQALKVAKADKLDPLYTLSITPESHGQFGDVAVVETNGAILKVYAGKEPEDGGYDPSGPYRFYDLLNGKLLFFADQWGLLAGRGTAGLAGSDRIIWMTLPIEKRTEGPIARIFYASSSGVLQHAEITMTPRGSFSSDNAHPSVTFSTPVGASNPIGYDTIRGEKATTAMMVFGKDAKTDGAVVRFDLDGFVDFGVPLLKDRLDFAHATVTDGFEIAPVE